MCCIFPESVEQRDSDTLLQSVFHHKTYESKHFAKKSVYVCEREWELLDLWIIQKKYGGGN